MFLPVFLFPDGKVRVLISYCMFRNVKRKDKPLDQRCLYVFYPLANAIQHSNFFMSLCLKGLWSKSRINTGKSLRGLFWGVWFPDHVKIYMYTKIYHMLLNWVLRILDKSTWAVCIQHGCQNLYCLGIVFVWLRTPIPFYRYFVSKYRNVWQVSDVSKMKNFQHSI